MSEKAAVGFSGVLPDHRIAQLIREGDAAALEPARTHGTGATRRCAVAALPGWTKACYDIISAINGAHFGFDVQGIETPQYMVYREGDHFGWHYDRGDGADRPRKLSMTLQLSHTSDYEGCDLQAFTGNGILTAKRERGSALAFPSFLMHQVTPLTRGERRALVVWAYGAPFV